MKWKIALVFAIALAILLSGCTQQPAQPSAQCGNNVVESGEQCDGSAGNCTTGQTCLQDCTCSNIPQPPALPD